MCLSVPDICWGDHFHSSKVRTTHHKFRRLLLRFERINQVHYAFKTLAYTMINLRHYCRN